MRPSLPVAFLFPSHFPASKRVQKRSLWGAHVVAHAKSSLLFPHFYTPSPPPPLFRSSS